MLKRIFNIKNKINNLIFKLLRLNIQINLNLRCKNREKN